MIAWWKALDGLMKTVVACALAFLVFAILFVLVRTFHSDRAAQEAKADSRIAEGEARAADGATKAVADYGDRQAGRVDLERENGDAIARAENAGDSAGAAGDAGLAGLCKRPSYQADPVCLRIARSPATR